MTLEMNGIKMIGILCSTMTYLEIFGGISLVSEITRSSATSTFQEKALKVKFEQTFVYLLLIFGGGADTASVVPKSRCNMNRKTQLSR